MSKYIKPTLTLSANSASATTDPGPLSVSLALSATDKLTVDTVKSQIIKPTTTAALLFDGSTEDDGGTAGTHGGFIYFKNVSASDYDVYIGVGAESMSATELEPATDADRFLTLKQGEFAFFPYDYEMDISVDAEHNDAELEYWLFNRAI